MEKNYKISLILATLGRSIEVKCFIESLIKQKYLNYELIVVDQNEKDFIKNMCNKYKNKINIKYIHSYKNGLSFSRNLGLQYATGEIIAFPDDDCEYSLGILTNVISKFNKNDIDIVTFKSVDKISGNESNNKWKGNNTYINTFNIFKTAISYTIFIKYKDIKDIIFDEYLGVGAYFGSSEETDMLLNLLHKGYIGKYFYDIFVFHPIKSQNALREYQYGLGYGALIKKEFIYRKNIYYIIKFVADITLKPILCILIYFLKCDMIKCNIYKRKLFGRIWGFTKYENK